MAKLIENSTNAERARGCVFAETFENAQAVAENGGVITGDTIINKGATLDGTGDYIDYNYVPITRDNHTITVDFDFTAGRGTTQIIAQWGDGLSTNNSGAIVIDTADGLRFSTNAGVAVYTAGALTTGRHTATCRYGGGAGASRATAVDGVEYSLSTTAGGAGSATAGITIGAETDHTNPFLGKIHSVKIFNNQLTLQEHTDLYNNSTYDYINTPVLDLPMGMAQHDPTNTRTLDISGNGNHAVFTNAPTKNADDRGYSFNGSSNYLTITNSSSLAITNSVTMSFWVKPNALSGNIPLIFKSASEYYVWLHTSGNIEWKTVGLSDETLEVSTSNLSLYKWNHLVFTYNGATKRILINGNEIASEAATGNITGGSNDIIIGRFSSDYYDGLASNVKIWNEGLTPLQIKDLYQRELKQINDI
jgi:hypothetical protein